MKIWSRMSSRGRWDDAFVNSAVDVVVDRTLNHFNNSEIKKPWRLPHTEVTEEKITGFLLDDFRFLDRYAEGAVYLTRLLKGLLEEDVPEEALSNRARRRRQARHPSSIRGCIAAMLMFSSSQKTNAFQTVMGIFLHCAGCPRRVLTVLSGLGLSISHSQVQNCLRSLTHDAVARIRKAAEEHDWYVVYDNINFAHTHHHQRTDKWDTFESGTTATLILFPPDKDKGCDTDMAIGTADVSSDMSTGSTDKGNGESEGAKFTDKSASSADKDVDKSTDRSASNMKGTGSNKKRPSRAVFRPESERPEPVADLFFPDDTDADVLYNAFRSHISVAIVESFPEGSSVHAIPIADIEPLSLHRTTAFPLRIMRLDESTIAGNLAVLERITKDELRLSAEWFENPTDTIVGGDQMTVARLLSLMQHRSVDPDPYHGLRWVHPTLQLFHLRMNLCGTIYRTHLGTQQFPGTISSIAVLLGRKGMNTPKPKFNDADELLQIIFVAMSQQLWEFLKHDDALEDQEEVLRVSETITNVLVGLGHVPPLMVDGLPRTAANMNALRFMRDVALYIELGESIKAGDIGRIHHLLPCIAIMMHGGGNTKYSIELLRLLYGTRQVWTDDWRKTVLSSMLVNPKGVHGRWMPADMYQEQLNYLIKAVFAAKGSNMSWEYLRSAISTNVRTFQAIVRMLEHEVGVRSSGTAHKKPSTAKDIAKVKEYLKRSGVLWGSGACKQGFIADDLWTKGEGKMAGGSIALFLSKHQLHKAVDLEDTENYELFIEQE
ncbi:hypothetical protein BGW42_007003 [Actinomortierella wolfii]|nr:hypothetical protein BGW42_007003 [Actinomortierella wolfii]